jgi:hypothetical protein
MIFLTRLGTLMEQQSYGYRTYEGECEYLKILRFCIRADPYVQGGSLLLIYSQWGGSNVNHLPDVFHYSTRGTPANVVAVPRFPNLIHSPQLDACGINWQDAPCRSTAAEMT